ncbi:hypothetical protein BU16DRAFT_391067 [Lophium mytilinum]|uniref:Uncharacterized protein n=1 Tax=Lophium mytilinum TaxID=390894 RepID=A0A6A6QTI7_9PEZI|nr:hypothetical protein BU16DRAFT_391067 [Lophium mytilinum]
MTPGLGQSKWALEQPKRRTPAQQLNEDKDKSYRLLRRLYWKAEGLLCSWNRALDAIKLRSNEHHDHPHSTLIDFALVEDGAMVQSMFKVDFFEFYVLLERYIVLCLAILGVRVSRKDLTAAKGPYHSGATPTFGMHQFHANLLATLDELECPLHAALGQQDVRIYLGRAKDYRNRWKDADELDGGPDATDSQGGRITLEDLKLGTMLKTILAGLEQASLVVKDRQPGHTGMLVLNGEGTGLQEVEYEAMDMDDAPWEAVGDAMDAMDWE